LNDPPGWVGRDSLGEENIQKGAALAQTGCDRWWSDRGGRDDRRLRGGSILEDQAECEENTHQGRSAHKETSAGPTRGTVLYLRSAWLVIRKHPTSLSKTDPKPQPPA